MSDSPQAMVEHYQQDERARILAMVPGPEMDREVAEKVMEWHIYQYDKDYPDNCYYLLVDGIDAVEPLSTGYQTEEQAWVDCPLFSTDIAAVWALVEEADISEICKSYRKDGIWYWCACIKGEYTYAKSVPEAICKAALLAVME